MWFTSYKCYLQLFQITNLIGHKFNKERKGKKKKKKDPEDTVKLQWWHHQYRWKDHDEMNLAIPKKVINDDRSESHE